MENTRPKRPVGAFFFVVALAAVFYAVGRFVTFPELSIISDYNTWVANTADGNILANIAYMFSDYGDPTYQKTALGGVMMLLGCIISLYMGKKSKCTFGVCYGSGLFWRVLVAQLIASGGSLLIFHNIWKIEGVAFLPSFIAIASFTPALLFKFGGEWRKVITAGILGIFMGCPFAYFINVNLASKWGLPGAVAWVTPMIISGFVSIEVCRVLPWMNKQVSDPEVAAPAASNKEVLGAGNATTMDGNWFVRRVFTEFSEPTFFGNELAGLLFVVGGVIACILNPKNPGYGDGNVYLIIVASQLLAAAIGIFLYWHRWYELGFYNTFVPLASLTPAFVLFYGTAPHVVIVGAICGAVFMPPVAEWIGRKTAVEHHGYIGSVVSMLICCTVFIAIFNFVPGFGVPFGG